MTTQTFPQDRGGGPDRGVHLNAGRLWVGGLATAVIAGLVNLIGMLIVRGVFGVAVPVPTVTGGMSRLTYVLLAIGAALLATLLLHVLLLGAPRPLTFFTWIVVLATIVTVVAPFSNAILGSAATVPLLDSKISVAVINLVAGIAIGTLLYGVARSSITRDPPDPGQYYPDQAESGQAFPGQVYPGQAFPGQAFPGQSYPGQSYPGQPYPGQPAGPERPPYRPAG
jgi:hypothetical protein